MGQEHCFLLYGIPIEYEKTCSIIEKRMRERAEEYKETYSDLWAAVKQKNQNRKAKRAKYEVERVVPSLFHLCLKAMKKKKKKRNAACLKFNLPLDVTQKIKQRKLAKKILWQIETDFEGYGSVLYEDQMCDSFDLLLDLTLESENEKALGPKIQCCSPYAQCPTQECEFFLCLHIWETLRGTKSFALEDFQHVVDKERPLWWHHALQMLQIKEKHSKPCFNVRHHIV